MKTISRPVCPARRRAASAKLSAGYAQRRRLLLRNALWCAWLRRPAPDAVLRSLALVREHRDVRVAATLAALAGAVWVLRHRRVAPPAVQRALRRLDRLPTRAAVV